MPVQLWFKFSRRPKDKCINGHEFKEGSFRVAKTRHGIPYRVCIECTKIREKRAYQKKTRAVSDDALDQLALAKLKQEGYR